MKDFLKRSALLFLIGAALGLVASMWWGPTVVTWWEMPNGTITVQMDAVHLQAIVAKLVRFQLQVSTGVGVVLVILGALFARWRAKRAAPVAAAPAPAAPPSGGQP